MRTKLFVLLLLGCGGPDAPDAGLDAGPDAGLDATADISVADISVTDAASPDVYDAFSQPSCVGEPVNGGAISGAAFGEEFSFPFITVGHERRDSLCPTLFIRASETAVFSADDPPRYFQLIVYFSPAIGPGVHTASVEWNFGGELGPIHEDVMVNITRADGLFEDELPENERRVAFSLSHHDATTDIEAETVVATYCTNFPICL